MVRRLIHLREQVDLVAVSDKEDHRHADTFRWHRSGQDDLSPRSTWRGWQVLVRKKFTQRQLLTYTANLQSSLIGLEACSGAHFLGRALRKQGHDVRLIAAQFVKLFVKSNKNDIVDAEAIAEAVERKNMRFVPVKTDEQLDRRSGWRTRQCNWCFFTKTRYVTLSHAL
jgi:transposase